MTSKQYSLQVVREPYGDLSVVGHKVDTPLALRLATKPLFYNSPVEKFVVIALDTAMQIIGHSVISVGSINASIVTPRAVYGFAMQMQAHAIAVMHNHPSGNMEPSREDIQVTRQLVEGGKILGIEFLDHIIVGPTANYVSFAERGLIAR